MFNLHAIFGAASTAGTVGIELHDSSVTDTDITDLQFVPGSHAAQFAEPGTGAEYPCGHGKHSVDRFTLLYVPAEKQDKNDTRQCTICTVHS